MFDRNGQLPGNYQLVRLLGWGGFSAVYLDEPIPLNTYAAMNILRPQLAEKGTLPQHQPRGLPVALNKKIGGVQIGSCTD